MGHPLSRGDFHYFPLFLFLFFSFSFSLSQILLFGPGGAILPPRPLVPSAGARSGGQGWPAFGATASGAQRPCMGHSLSRDEFHSFPLFLFLFLFLQFFCS